MKVAGCIADELTRSEAIGKGVKKGVNERSLIKRLLKTYEEGKEEYLDG